MANKRDTSFDIMKAIGIFAIIIGHFNIAKQFVFSFHVPLFFIVGGYMFRPKPMVKEICTDIRRLLWPYILTSMAILLMTIEGAIHYHSYNLIPERVIEILLGGVLRKIMFFLANMGK